MSNMFKNEIPCRNYGEIKHLVRYKIHEKTNIKFLDPFQTSIFKNLVRKPLVGYSKDQTVAGFNIYFRVNMRLIGRNSHLLPGPVLKYGSPPELMAHQ